MKLERLDFDEFGTDLVPSTDGAYVLYSDVERLQAALQDLLRRCPVCNGVGEHSAERGFMAIREKCPYCSEARAALSATGEGKA